VFQYVYPVDLVIEGVEAKVFFLLGLAPQGTLSRLRRFTL